MNSDWRPFAEKLTALAKAEGGDSFLERAFEFLNDFTSVDSCAVFKISADKTTGAEHLCTFGSLEPDLAALLAQDYVTNGFRNDPMVKTALTSAPVKVRHIPGSQYPNNYRSQYFDLGTREISELLDNEEEFYNRKAELIELESELTANQIECATRDRSLRKAMKIDGNSLYGYPLAPSDI